MRWTGWIRWADGWIRSMGGCELGMKDKIKCLCGLVWAFRHLGLVFCLFVCLFVRLFVCVFVFWFWFFVVVVVYLCVSCFCSVLSFGLFTF